MRCASPTTSRRPQAITPRRSQAYQQARYLRTARVQIMARIYGEFFHASGVVREMRNAWLGGRSAEEAMDGMTWLYGEQPELIEPAAAAKRARASAA